MVAPLFLILTPGGALNIVWDITSIVGVWGIIKFSGIKDSSSIIQIWVCTIFPAFLSLLLGMIATVNTPRPRSRVVKPKFIIPPPN